MRIQELLEGGWDTTLTQNTVLKPAIVGQALKVIDHFVVDFNKYLAKQGLGPVQRGRPTGSSAYHEQDVVNNPEKVYGDIDLQMIAPPVEGASYGQFTAKWNTLADEFVKTGATPYVDTTESKPGHPIVKIGANDFVQIDFDELHAFSLDSSLTDRLSQVNSFPDPKHFLPSGKWAHIYIPNYIYVPPEISFEMVGLEPHPLAYIQYLSWSRLKYARDMAFIEHPEIIDHWNTQAYVEYFTRSPFHYYFLQQTDSGPQHLITPLMDIQHCAAHQALKTNPVEQLSPTQFYDQFIRPLEFLVSRGLGLMETLPSAIFI